MTQRHGSPAMVIGIILVIFLLAGLYIGYKAGHDAAKRETCVPANK